MRTNLLCFCPKEAPWFLPRLAKFTFGCNVSTLFSLMMWNHFWVLSHAWSHTNSLKLKHMKGSTSSPSEWKKEDKKGNQEARSVISSVSVEYTAAQWAASTAEWCFSANGRIVLRNNKMRWIKQDIDLLRQLSEESTKVHQKEDCEHQQNLVLKDIRGKMKMLLNVDKEKRLRGAQKSTNSRFARSSYTLVT